MAVELPDRAQVVIIGGGVIGTSVAYHLTKLGLTDVVLLEQGQLSSGTTWHAAGLVGQLRASESATRLVQYSTQLYAELEEETGLSAGYKQCGGVTVARSEDRMIQLRRTAANAAAFNMECELLSPEQALEHYPVMRVDDLVGAIWLPADGKANPTDLTFALAKGARMRGTRVVEKTRATGILTQDGRTTGVRTDKGDIEAEIVVNCAGQWAKQVGAMAGVNVPLHSAEHFYVVTEDIDGVHPDLPILRDPDGYTYFKEEVGGLVIGGFEPEAKPWVSPDDIPYPFEFQLLEEDWDHFEILMNNALLRIPALEVTGIKKFYNGPESFTPDNQFILGEAPELDGFFVGAGFNSVGIATAGGAGRALAEWIVNGAPTSDLTGVDIRRFAPFNGNNRWLHDRVAEVLGLHYEIPWPNREMKTARPFRRSPVHHLLQAANANFGSRMGWERANFFAPAGVDPTIEYTWGKPNWLAWSAAEQTNTRTAVTVFDQTSFSKYLMVGPDAEPALQWLCTADVGGEVGKAVYTGMLNERGTYESDVTVTRTGADEYFIVSSAATTERDKDHIRRNLPGGHPRILGRRDVGIRRIRCDGAEFARPPVHPDRHRLVRRRVPVRHQPADLAGVRDRAGNPDHLRRRTGLGTLRTRRVRGRCVRGPDGGRRTVRSRPRRLLHDRIDAAGEGLSRLRPGTDAQREPRRGRTVVRLQAQDRRRVPGPRGRREGQGGGPAPQARRLQRRRTRSHAVGRRTGAARRCRRRSGHLGGVGRDCRRLRGSGLRAGRRQLRDRRRLGECGQLPGQCRWSALSDIGVAEADL